MINKNQLNNIQERFFDIFIYLSYILIFISALGLWKNAPTFLFELDYYVRIYICLFLIWRFNPFRSHYEFTNLDRKIAFSAGIFILTTTALNKYLNDTTNILKHLIMPKQS
jgi:hypothetical protein